MQITDLNLEISFLLSKSEEFKALNSYTPEMHDYYEEVFQKIKRILLQINNNTKEIVLKLNDINIKLNDINTNVECHTLQIIELADKELLKEMLLQKKNTNELKEYNQ